MATSYSLTPAACRTTLAQASVRARATSPWQSGVTPRRFMASRQMVRTSGTVTTSRGSRNEYRISTLTPLLTAADELWFASGEPLPGLGRCRTLGGTGRQRERDPEAGRNGPDEV